MLAHWQSPSFLLNSHLPLVTATCFPLRGNRHSLYQGYGANLLISLGRVFPTHHGLFNQSTCYGSRYGHIGSLIAHFSRAPGIRRTPHTRGCSCIPPLLLVTRLQGLQHLTCVHVSRCVASNPLRCRTYPYGIGILTDFPITKSG